MTTLVRTLLDEQCDHLQSLQNINAAMLNLYKLNIAECIEIIPLEVEICYVNSDAQPAYIDTNAHCMLDPKSDQAIRAMQSGRFGRLYCHRKGYGGVDVCLSESESYVLCCTIKAALVNGEQVWSAANIRHIIAQKVCQKEGVVADAINMPKVTDRLNRPDAANVLNPRKDPTDNCVYHIVRSGLRHRDSCSALPLRSFCDVWNKKLPLQLPQRINIYMAAHPDQDVVEVMRANNIRTIPYEIRIKYHIDRNTKL